MVAQVHSNWNLLLAEISRWIQLDREVPVVSYSTGQ
jgi:hypothetical protein